MKRCAFALIVCFLVSGIAVASDEAPPAAKNASSAHFDAVQALLRSHEARKRAWGAHLAGSLPRKRADAIRPLLVRLLDAHAYSKNWDDQSVAAAAWDALIRLRLGVTPDKLLTHLERWAAQAIALLVREPDENRPQLRKALEKGLRGTDWMAVVAELVQRRDPEIADHLLWGLRIELRMEVLPDPKHRLAPDSRKSESPRPRVVAAAGGRSGWPPFVDYGLTDALAEGDAVLVAGPWPVCLHRAVSAAEAAQRIRIAAMTPQHPFRIGMLETLAGTAPGSSQLQAKMRYVVHWTTPDDYVRKAQEAWAVIRRRHASLVSSLRGYGLLTEAQAMRQRLRLQIKATWHGEGERKFPKVPEPK